MVALTALGNNGDGQRQQGRAPSGPSSPMCAVPAMATMRFDMNKRQVRQIAEAPSGDLKTSRFRWILSPEKDVAIPDHDLPLFVSDLFVMMPTLGCLVPGWLLVVPRRPMPNLASLNALERQCLQELIVAIRPRLNCPGKEIFYFEHGSVFGSPASCGVDQAHLHIAPLHFDLIGSAIGRREVAWKLTTHRAYSLNVQQSEYLFVSDSNGRSMIGTAKSPSSQWFRRLIAAETGQHDLWDYRIHFGPENMNETAQMVGTIS